MEKSWNMKNLPKVMEFCDQPWNFTKKIPKILPNLYFFVTAKKLSNNLESPHFPEFSTKCHKCNCTKRDGHGKSRNGHDKSHGKILCKVCGNPVKSGPTPGSAP